MRAVADPVDVVRAALAAADGGEAVVEPGSRYTDLQPVAIRVRRRAHRFDVDDRGAAVDLAGRPPGWHEVATRVVALDGMNVNRAGVVFVSGVEGGRLDAASLADRLAETSAAVFAALLELEED